MWTAEKTKESKKVLLIKNPLVSLLRHIFGKHIHKTSISMFPVSNINEDGARQFLNKHKWPVGFQSILVSQITEKIPLRFFICDDSGSMFEDDGQHLVSNGTMHKALKCTR